MKSVVVIGLALVACMAATGSAQGVNRKTYPYFPYCPCSNQTGFHLDSAVMDKGNGKYCFRVVVNKPAGCDSYCCTTADVRKLEMDVNPACKVKGQPLSATINGKEATLKPTIEKSVDPTTNSYILKLTGMGLTMQTANGAEICITLGMNKDGDACSTLEQLCKPPAGSPAGVCNTALFDSKVDCCGMNDVPQGCETCVYVKAEPSTDEPFSFNPTSCSAVSNEIIGQITAEADKVGAVISSPFIQKDCAPQQIKICGVFASDADGAKLQAWADANIALLGADTICNTGAPVFKVDITGDGPDAASAESSCLTASATSTTCSKQIDFPKCKCEKGEGVSVFSVLGAMAPKPGRRPGFSLHCFQIRTDAQPAEPVPEACKGFTSLYKVELYADETYRRQVAGTAIKEAGASSYKHVPPSWGGTGQNTLKATALKWSLSQAETAEFCVELSDSVSIDDLCFGSGCTVSLFDASRKCCPTFTI